MIGVTVTFSYAGDFDRSRVTKVAQNARGMFEGMLGGRFRMAARAEMSTSLQRMHICQIKYSLLLQA